MLLRQTPIVTEAVCLQIGGNRFIDVYISQLGMDRRIHFEHMLPAVTLSTCSLQSLLTSTRSRSKSACAVLHIRSFASGATSALQVCSAAGRIVLMDVMLCMTIVPTLECVSVYLAPLQLSLLLEHNLLSCSMPQSWS